MFDQFGEELSPGRGVWFGHLHALALTARTCVHAVQVMGQESPGGFEPPTLNLGGSCSILLSYGDRMAKVYNVKCES